MERCHKFADASKKAKDEVKEASDNSKKKWKNRRGKANAAQETPTPTESAGAASIRHSACSSTLMPGMQTQGPLLI